MDRVTINISVDNALISGLTPNFTIENIFSGRVVLLGPDTKKLVITSSRDNVKDKSAPATIPGAIKGKVILVKVLN